MTRDDVEVTVPNAMIANAQLINEMGGPSIKQRVGIKVTVAFGTDVALVRRVLLECAVAEPLAEKTPAPNVQLRQLGSSGLVFELLVWLDYALPLVLWRLTRRTLQRLVTNEELWNGNREQLRDHLIPRNSLWWWALTTHRRRRRSWTAELALPEYRQLEVMRLRSPRAAREWLDQLRVLH